MDVVKNVLKILIRALLSLGQLPHGYFGLGLGQRFRLMVNR